MAATVLCVNGHPANLQTRQLLLESQGYTVLTCMGAKNGLECVRSHTLDAVILDSKVPGMPLPELAAQIKRVQPRVPVILVSDYAAIAAEPGMAYNAVVARIEGPDALLLKIKAVLDQTQAAKTGAQEARLRSKSISSGLSELNEKLRLTNKLTQDALARQAKLMAKTQSTFAKKFKPENNG